MHTCMSESYLLLCRSRFPLFGGLSLHHVQSCGGSSHNFNTSVAHVDSDNILSTDFNLSNLSPHSKNNLNSLR